MNNLLFINGHLIQPRCYKSRLALLRDKLNSRLVVNSVYFKRDGLNPKESLLIYRNEGQKSFIWLSAYSGAIAFFLTIYFIYLIIIHDFPLAFDENSYYNYDPADRLRHVPSIFILGFLNILSLLLVTFGYKSIARMYYVPKSKNFVVVLENFLYPYTPRKIICPAGHFQSHKNIYLEKVLTVGVIDNKKYLYDPDWFALPVFYNILFGYAPASSLNTQNINFDTEELFRLKIKKHRQHD